MTVNQPTLETERLTLAPLASADAPRVQLLAGDARIADTTATIPHPYTDGVAEAWISKHSLGWENGDNIVFGIYLKNPKTLIGTTGIVVNLNHHRGELGYWVGCDYWNQGYCTEAARETVRFGFEELSLNKIYAQHLSRNPSSGRVMLKLSMQHEGHFPRHVLKNGVYEDIEQYGLLSTQFDG